MVSTRLSHWLVDFAARRWSDHDEMCREWRAELHELESRGQHGQMLRFAFSLAVTRPFVDRRIVITAAVLIFTPVLTLMLWMLSHGSMLVFSEDIFDKLIGEWAYWLEETSMYVTMLTFGVWLAVLARSWARHSPVRAPLALAVLVVIPMMPVLVLVAAMGNMWRLDRAFPEFLIWPAGIALSLWAAGSASRRWVAWTTGLLGAFVTTQLAIMSVMAHVTTPVDWASSPLWLVSYFNYRGQMVNDVVAPLPELYLMMTLYALSYVLSAASPRQLSLHRA